MESLKVNLQKVYDGLYRHFGPQGWWPAESPFEVIVGAILTQNTSWKNVEKAILALKQAGVLNASALFDLKIERLAELIRPAGYFNVKTRRLKNFVEFFLREYGGDLDRMRKTPLATLREQLLGITGIGPETADAILLYALEHPIFVVDAYAYRILSRHFLVAEESDYHEMQGLVMEHVDAALYNEFHALIVQGGKNFCAPKPKCESCPLNGLNWNGPEPMSKRRISV